MTSSINFLPFSKLQKVPRGLGIVNHLIASKKIGSKCIHSGITLLPPKTAVPAHHHNAEEQVTVLQGRLKIIQEGNKTVYCEAFDSTFLSPGIQHELVNDSDEPVYALVIYGSVDVNRTFTETGETVGIGSDEDRFTAS